MRCVCVCVLFLFCFPADARRAISPAYAISPIIDRWSCVFETEQRLNKRRDNARGILDNVKFKFHVKERLRDTYICYTQKRLRTREFCNVD